MVRARIAVALAFVAALALAATATLVVTADDDQDPATTSGPVVVRDPASGASLQVPGEGWTRQDRGERISYGDAQVSGAALLDEGYCRARPDGSFRALAGFTSQPFDRWVRGLTGGAPTWSTGTSRESVELADGTPATLRWTALLGAPGPCSASGIELAMATAAGLRAVVVADSGEPGTLSHEQVRAILLGLELA